MFYMTLKELNNWSKKNNVPEDANIFDDWGNELIDPDYDGATNQILLHDGQS